jgi:hypothetical protein
VLLGAIYAHADQRGRTSVSTAVPVRTPVPGREARPSEISISLVDSLYKDGGTFLVGTILVTVLLSSILEVTGEILLLACALAIVSVACARGLLMYAYFRRRSTVTSLESVGYKVVVTASIGIALATSQIDPDQFLRNADMLCIGRKSRAAQRGAGLSQVWRPSLMRAELLNSICARP